MKRVRSSCGVAARSLSGAGSVGVSAIEGHAAAFLIPTGGALVGKLNGVIHRGNASIITGVAD